MLGRALSAICLLLVALLVPASSSTAQTSIDPSSGSPAGTVYKLPVDSGRADAAPKGNTRGSTGGAAGSAGQQSPDSAGQPGENSLYRSENNFGTSSRVPGAPGTKGSRSLASNAGAGVVRTSSDDTGNTSETAALSLLALLVVGGIAIGLISRRTWS